MNKQLKIIKRFIIAFVLILFALNYVNIGFHLMGASFFPLKEIFGFSMLLTLPFLPIIIDPDGVF